MTEDLKDIDAAASMEDVLQRRALALALETDTGETAEGLSLLLFRIAEEWYAVEADHVREIFQDYEVTSVPVSYTHLTLPTLYSV